MSVVRGNNPIHITAEISPPAALSWSPKAQAFFLNDGDGSGMASRFRLFLIEKAAARESSQIESTIVSTYRRLNRCNHKQADPNVYGIGWSPDGQQVYLIGQSTVNEPCGRPNHFRGYVANVSNERIVTFLNTQETKARFNILLPKELR